MTLDDLDLPPGFQADAERWMGDMEMSEDVFISYMVETYGPDDEGQDRKDLYRMSVICGVEALRDVEAEAEPD